MPGGIAEMFVVNEETESLYLKTRQNTIKAAIQEGADIVPTFFFGNSRTFTVLGAKKDGNGAESGLAKLSRKFRASILFFYGRHFLPVPYRQHLHMATGNVVPVTQNDQVCLFLPPYGYSTLLHLFALIKPILKHPHDTLTHPSHTP